MTQGLLAAWAAVGAAQDYLNKIKDLDLPVTTAHPPQEVQIFILHPLVLTLIETAEEQRSRLKNRLEGLPRITLCQTMMETMVSCWHGLEFRRLQYWGRGGSIICIRAFHHDMGETSGPEKGSLYPGLQSWCVVAIKAGHFINKIQPESRRDTDANVASVTIRACVG